MFERINFENLANKIDDIKTSAQLKEFLHELLAEDTKLVLELKTVLHNLNSDNVTRLNLAKTDIGNPRAAGLATLDDLGKLESKYHSAVGGN